MPNPFFSSSHSVGKIGETPGAQNMRRALQVLRVLGQHHADGMTVKEVMAATQLERSTTHRLLKCLTEEHFADQHPISRRYRLGLEVMQLGFASLARAPLLDTYSNFLRRLARITEDGVFLVVRQGDYSVCLQREEGTLPAGTFTTQVGHIYPLGVGIGGMALLACSTPDEIKRIRQKHSDAFELAGLGMDRFDRIIAKARRVGYIEMTDVGTQKVVGVSAAVPNRNGEPFAAIAIATTKQRMPPSRRADLGQALARALSHDLKNFEVSAFIR